MKKLLFITCLILSLCVTPIIADDSPDQEPNTDEIEISVEELEVEITEDEEQTTTLSDQLEVRQENDINFLSILIAIVAPSLFIVLAYLLIKMTKE